MSYTRETWVELASTDPSSTPITAIRLNNIEAGIENSHGRSLVTTARDLLVSSDGNLFTGRVIWNSTLSRAQWYDGSTWVSGSAGGEAPANVSKSTAVEGTSRIIATANHKHDVDTSTPVDISTSNDESTGSALARAGHIHNHPGGLGEDLHHTKIHGLGTSNHSAGTLVAISGKISDGTIVIATSDEAVAGTDNNVRMTPLRVTEAIGPKAVFASGTYTGDGTTDQGITGVGFQPKFVMITIRKTTPGASFGTGEQIWTNDVIIDDDASGGALRYISNGTWTFDDDRIISLDADGFSVDDNDLDQDPNTNTLVYNYWALG